MEGRRHSAAGGGGAIAVIDAPSGGYADEISVEREALGETVEIRKYLISPNARSLLFDIQEHIAILWHHVHLDAEFFSNNTTVRIIICASVGFDHVDLEGAAANGVAIYHVPHYGTEEVADHTLALFLSLARRVPAASRHVNHGGWAWQIAEGAPRLRDTHWGIVGLGRIGTAVALRAKAFGMTVAFFDPHNLAGIEKSLGLTRVGSLEQLLRASDVVSLHLPLTGSSRHLLDIETLAMMRSGAYLINTARGGLIDTAALERAIAVGRPGFVGLDVVEEEPTLPSWLLGHERVLITPHSAFYSKASLPELRKLAALAARDLLQGRSTIHAALVTQTS